MSITLQAHYSVFHEELKNYAIRDKEAALCIGQDLDQLAKYASSVMWGINGLPNMKRVDVIYELDELVQDAADKGKESDRAAEINNDGPVSQISYILAYNGIEGMTVIYDKLKDLLPEDAFPGFVREMSNTRI